MVDSRRIVGIVLALCAGVLALGAAGAGRRAVPTRMPTADAQMRERFLEMFARGYYPGRSGQLFVVPKQGHFVSGSDDTLYFFMHGSPWDYDTRIPLIFYGAGRIRQGEISTVARQQDIVPTLAHVLGMPLPATVTGHALEVWREGSTPPAVVLVIVLDGMRADYLNRESRLPVLTAVRKGGASFPNARIDYLPTNTAVGHATISTGSDPRFHGIVGNSMYDVVQDTTRPPFAGANPDYLLVPTVADLWSAATHGRARILAQGGNVKSGTALAGHGSGSTGRYLPGKRRDNPVWLAAYDENMGKWTAGKDSAFSLSPGFEGADDCWKDLPGFPPEGPKNCKSMRHSPYFARCEGRVAVAALDAWPVRGDSIPALALINLKTLDFVGHAYGPDSPQMDTALAEVDAQVGNILSAVRNKVGENFVVAVTADHGMPPGDRRFARDRRHTTNAVRDSMNNGNRGPIAFYEGEDAQIFLRPEYTTRTAADSLAHRLARSFFAVFTADSVRRAASRVH